MAGGPPPGRQRYLEANERKLPIRAVWLVASRLAAAHRGRHPRPGPGPRPAPAAAARRGAERRAGPAVLPAVRRAQGLRPAAAGPGEGDGAAPGRPGLGGSQPEVTGDAPPQSDQSATLAYIDLLFAFALAKLGEADAGPAAGRGRPAGAGGVQAGRGQVAIAATFLFQAFRYRVEQALAGKPHAGLLDRASYRTSWSRIDAKATKQAANSRLRAGLLRRSHRMREQSQILEPQEKLDPYGEWMRHGTT